MFYFSIARSGRWCNAKTGRKGSALSCPLGVFIYCAAALEATSEAAASEDAASEEAASLDAASAPPVTPPKGLQSQTRSRIEAYLRAAPETRHTSDEIASHVGLSVVTVRRYMNYLAEQQVIGSEMDYRTGGRPCLVYFLRK